MDAESTQQGRNQGLLVPWGWLSLVLTIISITALGTLAVIAKRQGADALSTIALALAILSFSAQLIVTLAQAYNGTLQVAQADAVNAETKSLLAEIRATSQALLTNQRGQFSEVLHAALKIAVPAAVQDVEQIDSAGDDEGADGRDTEESVKHLEERLDIRLNEAIREIRAQATMPTSSQRAPLPMVDRIVSYPSESRGRELLPILNGLGTQDATQFTKIATQIMDRARRGSSAYVFVREYPSLDRFEKLGLVKVVRMSEPKVLRRVRLTDLGMEVASLVLGVGPRPKWLTDDDGSSRPKQPDSLQLTPTTDTNELSAQRTGANVSTTFGDASNTDG